MWAIQKGVRRAYSGYNRWRPTDARKDHECIRGCEIKRGDVYFKMDLGGGWGNDLKACAGCMAMILYFQGAYELTRHGFYTHWSFEEDAPVRVEDATKDDK